MTDVYEKLAKHLDSLPASYPSTDSGVELRILKRLFNPEEAQAAMALTMLPESAGSIAKKMDKNESNIEKFLYDMSKKGLIYRFGQEQKKYMAANFVVGIWEFNVNNLDEELIHDVNEYLSQIWEKNWATQKTQQLRVVPISKSIPAEMNIMPYEKAENIIKEQSKILVAPCICRKEQQMVGHGCDKPLETCLILGTGALFYEENGIGHFISQEEALKILDRSLEAGLVLQPSNSQDPSVLCMCCGCCCLVLKNLNTMDEPAKVACTNFYVTVSEDDCTGCGDCESICQMGAVTLKDELAVVNLARCLGCGLCVAKCEFDAATLVAKEESEQYAIPATVVDQYINIAQERGLI